MIRIIEGQLSTHSAVVDEIESHTAKKELTRSRIDGRSREKKANMTQWVFKHCFFQKSFKNIEQNRTIGYR